MAVEEKPNFSGKWQVYKQENFEEFLQAVGKLGYVINNATRTNRDAV